MKHCQYIGYPTQFYHLGIEGSSEFHPYAYTAECKMRKTIGNFFSTLEQHGYDVIQKKDGYLFEKALADLNECIKKSRIKEGYATYTHLDIENEICRCGKFIFMTRSPYYSEEKELDIEKSRGGKRTGSGRKGPYEKILGGDNTTVIRVPKYSKDKIKGFVEWLAEKAVEGTDVSSALWSGIHHIGEAADNLKDILPDVHEKLLKEKSILEELYCKIPSLTVKEEYRESDISTK